MKISFQPIRALKFLTGHVIFKLRYNQIYQLKTTHVIYNPAYTYKFQLKTTYCIQNMLSDFLTYSWGSDNYTFQSCLLYN